MRDLIEKISKFLNEHSDLRLKGELRSLVSSIKSQHPEVKLDVSWGDASISIGRIVVPKEMRNQGIGSKILEDIHNFADQNGLTVSLTPSADFGGSKARLIKLYSGMGYIKNSGRKKDYEISDTMYRPPRK